MKPYGLLGEKLGHSFSPLIHSRFGDYEYRLFPTPREELESFLKSGTFGNLNVTIPYKKEVIPYCQSLSPLAKRIGSVNTIKVKEDGLHGYNTDYFGFCTMLKKGNIPIKGEKCAVIGSGGVSATVCAALEDLGAGQITVITEEKNTPAYIDTLADHTVVVNTSPVGMFPRNGRAPLDLRQFHSLKGVADLIFNPLKTALMLQAEELGIPCVGGLIMLVAQAKQAAEIFEDKQIDDALIDAVTDEIQKQCENIILIGMPGSGKSEIGSRIAKALSKPFVDTDSLLEDRAGKPIPQIFAEDGEDAFRTMETQVLAEVSAKSGLVISTGGGIVKRAENLPLLRQNGKVLFLERPLESLSTNGRPLSSSPEAVQKLYTERYPLYVAASDLRVTNNSTIEAAVERALRLL